MGKRGGIHLSPRENEIKDRNSVEVKWDVSRGELGHQDENNWAVTQVGAGATLQASVCYSSPGNFMEGQRKWADLVSHSQPAERLHLTAAIYSSLSFLERMCIGI